MPNAKRLNAVTASPAGRSIREFSREVGISVATYFNLVEACSPRTARVGARVIVTEPPAEWLDRMAALGGAKTRRWPSPPGGSIASTPGAGGSFTSARKRRGAAR